MKALSIFSAAVLLHVVTGQDLACDGTCVATWKKCAGAGIESGSIRPCCSEDAHCVEKTSNYSQCRPKSQDVPASWPSGAILTCTDSSTACDPTKASVYLGGLSAWRKADNRDIQLDFLGYGDLDYLDTTCDQECQDNPECFVYEKTADEDCSLFGKDLFTLAGELEPDFDSELILTKCFFPEPLCDPATREVRRLNPAAAPGGGPHQMDAYTDSRTFGAGGAHALTSAINACRLQQVNLGGCIGFAIEGTTVTLLYRPGPGTTDFVADPDADEPLVYSIEACL